MAHTISYKSTCQHNDALKSASRPFIRNCGNGCTEYKLLIVTDLDRASKAGNWTWRAITRQGLLKLDIHPKPHVTNKNWIGIYNKMKASYLTHEAVQWSARRGRWFFLPRKASNTPYNETVDEKSSTNLDRFEYKTVGKVVPERGYSAFAFIPDTNDDLIVALKSKEVGDSTATYITVFNIEGQVILQDEELSGDYKFEGLYFL
ncbi:unnamed protein product [Haemonchus placei]|uniref:Apyrase n=1 Tax=Haemonchus placei TaxID=6290 RepID=A0A0N4WTS8_HAEPC|nr:unnamed protein product [Haemonchus placei]